MGIVCKHLLSYIRIVKILRFYMPHGFAIDQENFYYTTDVGSLQVTKWEISNGKLFRGKIMESF